MCAAGVLLLASAVTTGGQVVVELSDGGPSGAGGTTLTWKPCEGEGRQGFECATAKVPLDYARPRWRTIDLVVIRHRATAPGRRVGSLFFNPGGPGGAGTVGLPLQYHKFPKELRERFDIVSWDPRGVGQSTAVQCFASAEEAVTWLENVPAFPVSAKERRTFTAAYAELGRRCQKRVPELLRHVSTDESARDLDRLRQALGERQLRYWGVSYGTLLGATYANLFPSKDGRLVLDGNVDPRAWVEDGSKSEPELNTFLRLGSDLGSADALREFLRLCGRAPASSCAFSAGNPAATRAKLTELLGRLPKRPVGSWTYAKTVSEIRGGLYTVHPGWAETAQMLQTLWEGRIPEDPPAPPVSLTYPGFEQSLGVLCAESPNPRDPARYVGLAKLSTARAGDLGHWWAWANEPCATWPARAVRTYTGPWNRHTATPVLVVNATYDPATSYRAGKAMARELADTRLLTVNGYGHTSLDNPSGCVGRHTARYFLSGVLPPVGATCEQDVPPFAPFATETPAVPDGRGVTGAK
ncbi:alpha/beta fold hydrolase [Streptomyces sp. NPDC048496]|uniref:alpha/beta fold hydrolase n=1 Tax=Streptomyces sp. NPDC048496 TaxID=3365558 RepID=UPI003724B3E6